MHLGAMQLAHIRLCESCRRRIRRALETTQHPTTIIAQVPITSTDQGEVP